MDEVYKIIELSGTSNAGIKEAVQHAVSRAAKTIHGLSWFEVKEVRGLIENNDIAGWQVVLKMGFGVDLEKEIPADFKPGFVQDQSREQPSAKAEKTKAAKYRCKVCGYIYDPEKGDLTQNIKPQTPFEQLPDTWKCPECGVGKEEFERI